jgi:hypothetical protein
VFTAGAGDYCRVTLPDWHYCGSVDVGQRKAAAYVDALTGEFLAYAIGAVDSTGDQIVDKVGTVQDWGRGKGNYCWPFCDAGHEELLEYIGGLPEYC